MNPNDQLFTSKQNIFKLDLQKYKKLNNYTINDKK